MPLSDRPLVQHARTGESDYLLDLARHITEIYALRTKLEAAMLIGSAAEGVSDRFSDLDMGFYYRDVPSDEVLESARSMLGATDFSLLAPRSERGLLETFMFRGIDCQLIHVTTTTWEADIDTVLVGHDAGSVMQKALEGLLHAIPLHGQELVTGWQERAREYPAELGIAMIRNNLQIRPIWFLADRISTRDGTMFLHQMRIDAIQSILGILAGLNHVYFSTFQFKRMERFVAGLRIAPESLIERLNSALESSPVEAAFILEDLASATLALVEIHAPQIDLDVIRRPAGARQQPWVAFH